MSFCVVGRLGTLLPHEQCCLLRTIGQGNVVFLHASVQLSVIRMTSCLAFKILTSTSPLFFFRSGVVACPQIELAQLYLLQPPDSHFLFFFQRIQFMLGRLVPVCLFFGFCNVCSLYFKIFSTLSHEELRKD